MNRKLIITIDDNKKPAWIGSYNLAAIWGREYGTGVTAPNFPPLPAGPMTMCCSDARLFVSNAANMSEVEADEWLQLDGVTSIWVSNNIFIGLKEE